MSILLNKRLVLTLGLIALGLVSGCYFTHNPFDPEDENIRYMYITVHPDRCTLDVVVEFKDETRTFRDQRVTSIHEPIPYSVDRRKVKRVSVKVSKFGWKTTTREWIEEVPIEVFIKLDEAR